MSRMVTSIELHSFRYYCCITDVILYFVVTMTILCISITGQIYLKIKGEFGVFGN